MPTWGGRLGQDGGDVRVHNDGAAHESATSVNAPAYTVGSNIVSTPLPTPLLAQPPTRSTLALLGRAAAAGTLRSGQTTAGNSAVAQRLGASAPVAQRSEEDEVEDSSGAGDARQGRTIVSKVSTSLRELSKRLMEIGLPKSYADKDKLLDRFVKPGVNRVEVLRRIKAAEEKMRALKARHKAAEKWLGQKSVVGRGLRGSNYVLQFWEKVSRGQDVGEAAVGAAVGGFINNNMTRRVFNRSPKLGWVDTLVNLGNAGLTMAGAPKELTGFTQAAADATPTSFATSVGSNSARAMWNLARGDWSGLRKQGDDLVRGREGAPLQGYALVSKLFQSREEMGETTEAMRRGEYGFVPETTLAVKDAVMEGSPIFGERRQRWLKHKANEPARVAAYNMARRREVDAEQAKAKAWSEQLAEIEALIYAPPGGVTSKANEKDDVARVPMSLSRSRSRS